VTGLLIRGQGWLGRARPWQLDEAALVNQGGREQSGREAARAPAASGAASATV
jgi:hypothetical protein